MKTTPKTAAALVQLRPNPTRCRTRITDPDQAPVLRRLDCGLYDGCLSFAAKKDWRGFHCNDCKAYKPLTPSQRQRDHIAIMEMLEETQLLPALLVADAITDESDHGDDAADGAPAPRGFAPDPEDDLDDSVEVA